MGYNQYTIKRKASVEGHVWVGRNLVPQLIFYSFFFVGAFIAEISLILFSLVVKSFVIETSFWFLIVIPLVAMLLFIKEGSAMYRKIDPKRTDEI